MAKLFVTETDPLLRKCIPDKLAPPNTIAFSLVLLDIVAVDREPLIRALQNIFGLSDREARRLVDRRPPVVLITGLCQDDAELIQSALIMCDAVSVFLRDDVAAHAEPAYLAELYSSLRTGSEFDSVSMRIESIPDSEEGKEFRRRFLPHEQDRLPIRISFMGKQARIIEKWAMRVGARVAVPG